MRLLDRYLLRELLSPLLYCLGGFLIFWISFDVISELDEYRSMAAAEIARLYAIKLPELLIVVMPIALLLAVLYALTHHARHQEITAMRAAGLSLWRISAPYLLVGLLFAGAYLAINEMVVPRSSDEAERLVEQSHALKSDGDAWKLNLSFKNERDGRVWNLSAFNIETFEMRNPQVSWQIANGVIRTLDATNAVWSKGQWIFNDVSEITIVPRLDGMDRHSTNYAQLAAPEFSETPEQIKSEIKISRLSSIKAAKEPQLSISEILNYFRLHPELAPRDRAMLHTQFHGRLAAPLTCLVVVIIALPFAAPSGRRNVFAGVASSIFICFSYFVLLKLGLALGTGQKVAPWVGAWLPNVVFTAAGLWLTSRVR